MPVITFWVPGHAKTKGSMNKVGARMVQTVKGSTEWAALVTDQARRALQGAPLLVGPVAVRLAVWLPVADITARGSGDVDKLARNVLDALDRAGVYGDDAQVADLHITKYRIRGPFEPYGLLCRVEPCATLLDGTGVVVGCSGRDERERGNAMRAQGLLS